MTNKDQKIMDVLKYIYDFSRDNGYPPSVREICAGLNIKSTASVYTYIERLSDRGYIRKSTGKNRAIEIVKGEYMTSKKEIVEIPLVGKITAGTPIEAVENIDEVYTFPSNLFARGDLMMLTVSGDSMIEAGIFDKDKIVIRRQPNAENGQIVAAKIDDEATVKRFYRGKNNFILHPENPMYEDIVVDNVEILGVLVGLIRTF